MLKSASVKFHGGKNIIDALKSLGRESSIRNVVRRAVYQGANVIRDDARIFASLVKPRKRKKRMSKMLYKRIKTVRHRGKRGQAHASVVCTAPHGHLVEFGTAARYRGIKSKRRKDRRLLMDLSSYAGRRRGYTGSMPAKPFMRPAVELNRRNAAQKVIDESWTGIKKQVAKRNAGKRTR